MIVKLKKQWRNVLPGSQIIMMRGAGQSLINAGHATMIAEGNELPKKKPRVSKETKQDEE